MTTFTENEKIGFLKTQKIRRIAIYSKYLYGKSEIEYPTSWFLKPQVDRLKIKEKRYGREYLIKELERARKELEELT